MKDLQGNKLQTRTAWIAKKVILCPKCGSDCEELPILYTEAKTLKCVCGYLSCLDKRKVG